MGGVSRPKKAASRSKQCCMEGADLNPGGLLCSTGHQSFGAAAQKGEPRIWAETIMQNTPVNAEKN